VVGSSGASVTILALAPALVLMGVGMGMVMAPFFDIVLAGVSPEESGSASGTLTAVQQIGGALGIAVLGTVFFGHVEGAGPPTIDRFTSAVQACVWVAVAMVAVAWLLTYLLPRRAEHHGAH
jgi:MFS family permease